MAKSIDFDKKVEFKRKVIQIGTSMGITIPPELCEFLGGVKKGNEIVISANVGRFGPFLAVFKKEE